MIMHFTDDKYCDIDDIKRELGIHNVNSIMEKQLKYRSQYASVLELKNYDNKNFCFVLSPGILYRVSELEKKLFFTSHNFNHLENNIKADILNKQLVDIGLKYASYNKLDVNEERIKFILQSENIEQKYLSIKNYLINIQNILYIDEEKFELSTLNNLYRHQVNYRFDGEEFNLPLRDNDINKNNETTKDYDGAPAKSLQLMIHDLLVYANNEFLFSTLKAFITYYYILFIKPFECFNEEVALLSLKYILCFDHNPVLPILLNLENDLLDNKDLHTSFVKSSVSRDLTYFILDMINILNAKLDDFDKYISPYLSNNIKINLDDNNLNQNVNDNSIPLNNNQFDEGLSNMIKTEQKVSLPVIPVGLSSSAADLIVESLLELYPSMKKLQAYFYSRHCTIGKYYTISQYKTETGVVYETARTSMDNLVTLNLYKKELIGKKFVYTPVVRKDI